MKKKFFCQNTKNNLIEQEKNIIIIKKKFKAKLEDNYCFNICYLLKICYLIKKFNLYYFFNFLINLKNYIYFYSQV